MTPASTSLPAPSREAPMELCAFAVGDEEYAIDIMRVREIIRPLKVTPVPHAPAFLEGVVNLRGVIIPVVNLRARLGLAPSPATRRSRLVICRVGGKLVALAVDAVKGVTRVPRSQVSKAPALLATGSRRLFLGMVGEGGAVKLLLNVKALVSETANG